MKRDNALVSIFLYIVSIYVLISARSLPPESAKFPTMVAYVLIGLNTIFLYQVLAGKLKQTKRKDDIVPKKMWMIMALSIAYVFTIDYFGYFLLTPIYLLSTMSALGVKNKKMGVIVTVVSVGLIYICFKVLLKVPVPQGILFK